MRALILTLAMVLTISAAAAEGNLIIQLSPTEQRVAQGSTPVFSISVSAVSSPVKIMRFENRPDLKDSYVRLIVTRNKKEVDLPIAISDPGPVDDKDYSEIFPGKEMSFTHDGSPLQLLALPVGTYSVRVKLRPDWRAEPVWSNSVSLRVVAHGS